MVDARWIADTSRSPIVVVEFDDPARTVIPDAEGLIAAIEEVLKAAEPVVCVLDLSRIVPDARRRAQLIDYYRKRRSRVRRTFLALAIVAPSRLVAGAFAAFSFVVRPDVPTKVFTQRAIAIAWALEKVKVPHSA